MKGNPVVSESPPLSLNFVSTQIQSRHEVQEQIDSDVARLQRFKNEKSSEVFVPEKRVKLKHRAKRQETKTSKAVTLLNAFVRGSLVSNKPLDSHSILGYFNGDKGRAEEFISDMEAVTASPLSRKNFQNELSLFTGQEWRFILDTLRKKFPNLSAPKRKSLKSIIKCMESLKESEAESQVTMFLQSLWSQASVQPNEDLTAEDLKWLYDLDEEQVLHNTSIEMKEFSSQTPFLYTLSQEFNDSSQQQLGQSSSILDNESTVEDSEASIDPFDEEELKELQKNIILDDEQSEISRQKLPIAKNPGTFETPLNIQLSNKAWPALEVRLKLPNHTKYAPSIDPYQNPKGLDFIDIKTSIFFATNSENLQNNSDFSGKRIRSSSVVEIESPVRKLVKSSPTKLQFEGASTPCDRPRDMVIDSSSVPELEDPYRDPLREQGYSQLQTSSKTSQSLDFAKCGCWKIERVCYLGKPEFQDCTEPNTHIKILNLETTLGEDVVPDSEEEEQTITVIEVGCFYTTQSSILQVPSSP